MIRALPLLALALAACGDDVPETSAERADAQADVSAQQTFPDTEAGTVDQAASDVAAAQSEAAATVTRETEQAADALENQAER